LLARIKGEVPDAHGLIVGETKDRKEKFLAELKAKAAALGMSDHITFTGHRSDLREIMAISKIVFSLSREPEAFGRTTVEALSLGIPVIGYNHGGVGEQLSSVFPQGCVMAGNIGLAAQLTRQWLQACPKIPLSQPFTLNRMLETTLAVYKELIPGTP